MLRRLDRYARYRRAIEGEPLPLALLDLEAVDRNILVLLEPIRAKRKRLRVATKSLRCLALIRHVVESAGATAIGLMAYAAREAAVLSAEGFDDVLVAYPTAQRSDAAALAGANASPGKTVSIVADAPEQLLVLEEAARAKGVRIPVVVDADMGLRYPGGVHLGVRRSPLFTPDQVAELAERIAASAHLRFHGVMGYEAQVAGLQDANPYAPAMNLPKRLIRSLSRAEVASRRARIVEVLAKKNLAPPIFNGGGTGSVDSTSAEDAITEVTVGSGFVDSHLFDYYHHGPKLEPALAFALQVVRHPAPSMVTCHGGGYVASGQPGPDKLPKPWLPESLALTDLEGAGEVQTPLAVKPGAPLPAIGDPVFFRHAKAGELAEHFREYLFVRGEAVVSRAPTYRGQGHAFL